MLKMYFVLFLIVGTTVNFSQMVEIKDLSHIIKLANQQLKKQDGCLDKFLKKYNYIRTDVQFNLQGELVTYQPDSNDASYQIVVQTNLSDINKGYLHYSFDEGAHYYYYRQLFTDPPFQYSDCTKEENGPYTSFVFRLKLYNLELGKWREEGAVQHFINFYNR